MADQTFTISENDVVVIGSRETIKVDTSFGPQGTRGGLILYGSGRPDSDEIAFSYSPQLLDWYINLDVTDTEYLFLYQYVSGPEFDNGIGWRRIFKIIPNEYNTNIGTTFVDGASVVTINITNSSISLLGVTNLSKLNTHITIETDTGFPIASSFKILPYTFDEDLGAYVVPIRLYAAQLNPLSGWEAVTGQATAHVSINMI